MASSSSSSPELSGAAAASSSHQFASIQYSNLSRDEVLEDLSSRFILNLPEEELASVERVCFQVEQAHWYYEDFIREQNTSKFPSYTLKTFSEALFRTCPLLTHWAEDHDRTFDSFMKYKTRVPVCGAIMLNDTWDKCVLVKGWKSSAGWGFPKGKINEQEPKHRCAIREVLEETGYNLEDQLDPENVIQMSIKEQSISLYVVPGVPEDFPFKTKTRKEISKIAWFRLTDLPTWKRNRTAPGKFYLISPFIGPLKAFIHDRKPRNVARNPSQLRIPTVKEELHSSSEEECTTVNDQSSVGNSQELSSQASSAEPHTPSPQYSAARVHQSSFESSIDSDTTDPARPPSLEGEKTHLASLLNNLQRSAASLNLDSPPKPQLTLFDAVAAVPTAPQRPAPDVSPDWSARVPAMRNTQTAAPQASSRPATASPQPLGLPPFRPTPQPTTSPALVHPHAGPGHARRGSTTTADISPYLSHPRNITKEMRYISILESVAQESDRSASRMAHRSPMVPSIPAAAVPVPQALGPHPTGLEHSVIYSSSTTTPQIPIGLPYHPMHPSHAPDSFMGRPRTSHAFHGTPFGGPGLPRQSMNEHQLRSLLSLGGQCNGVDPSFAARPFPMHAPPQARPPTSPARVLPPYQFPPPPVPHIAHNNAVRAANNAQLLSILNTPNPVYRA